MSVIPLIDPRLKHESNLPFYAFIGAENIQYYAIPASGFGQDQIVFSNLTTLGRNMLYMDNFMIDYGYEISFKATISSLDGENILYASASMPGLFAFRGFPLNNAISQMNVIINGNQTSSIPRETELFMSQFRTGSQLIMGTNTTCPVSPLRERYAYPHILSMIDGKRFRNVNSGYQDFVPYARDDSAFILYMRENGEVGNYPYDAIQTGDVAMGGPTQVRETTFTLKGRIREPLLCCPFNSNLSAQYPSPVWGIESLEIRLWLQDLHRMFTISPNFTALFSNNLDGEPRYGTLITSEPKCTLTDAMLRYAVISTSNPMTDNFITSYSQFLPFIKELPSIPAEGGSATYTSAVYSLSVVPQMIYMFVAPSMRTWSDKAHIGTIFDVMPITHVKLTFGNNTEIMNTYDEYELAQIALRNGVKKTYGEYMCKVKYTRQGGVLPLVPGVDFVIPGTSIVPGTQLEPGAGVFQATVTVRRPMENPYPPIENYSLYIYFQNIGTYTITPTEGIIDMIPIKSVDFATSPMVIPTTPFLGGGFIDTLKKLGSKVWKSGIIGNVLDAIPNPYTQIAARGVKAMGGGVMAGSKRQRMGGGAVPTEWFN